MTPMCMPGLMGVHIESAQSCQHTFGVAIASKANCKHTNDHNILEPRAS